MSTLEAEISGLKQVVAEKNGHIDRFSDIEIRLQELIVSKESISSSYEELSKNETRIHRYFHILHIYQMESYLLFYIGYSLP